MDKKAPCCPRFDPLPWDGVTQEWQDKPFLLASIPQIFHLPLPGVLNQAITRLWNLASDLGVAPPIEDFLLLATDPSPWKSDLYLAVNRLPEGVPGTFMSGSFFSMVFDGPYNAVPRYIREMELRLAQDGRKAKRYFFYYTTCPSCAREYGHNYIVAFAEL